MTEVICRSSERRAAVRATPALTGIDAVAYLRYADDEGVDSSLPARPRVRVRLLGGAPDALLQPRAWRIEGGRRIRGLRVRAAELVADPEGDQVVELDLNEEGDASTYTIRLIRDRDDAALEPLEGVDPRYDRASFTFKLDCPATVDCAERRKVCDGGSTAGPLLDYTAKDYASFRQLLLERLSLVLPAWRERHVPDIGVTLVELMAYVGDHLSYRQDVIATEAYLETARLRRSIRRHARLVDYAMHEGVNARAWVAVCSDKNDRWRAADVAFYTRVAGWQALVSAESVAEAIEAGTPFEVFLPVKEALRDGEHIEIKAALGRIRFYTWGGEECCLPRGATRATLQIAPDHEDPNGTTPPLGAGDVLILEEVLGPQTGRPEHADPTHRHAVRLKSVTLTHDPVVEGEQRLYDVEWVAQDALPFALCLSSLNPDAGCAPVRDVSVARGNVVLVDHGREVSDDLGSVEGATPVATCEGPGRTAFATVRATRLRPQLPRGPLTFRAPLPSASALDREAARTTVPPAASVMLRSDARAALPALQLATPAHGAVPARTWSPKRDLLESSADDVHFVVEMDDEGDAHLRFGDDVNGLAPEPGTAVKAHYRIGNGPAGNVASESIVHVAVQSGTRGHVGVRNPLPAAGGQAPEPVDDVRLLAPASLRERRERAVIPDDYASLALRDHEELQRASAALRWTGSWYEVLVGLDPKGEEPATPALCATLELDLERYRRIGHDLRVSAASYVPVRVRLEVCARPQYQRAHVRAAVLEALVGHDGLFHPDRFTFGQTLALSALVAAVQAVPGVLDVSVLAMERLFKGDQGELDAGELRTGALEIVQLEHDPAMPEHGVIELGIGGGR